MLGKDKIMAKFNAGFHYPYFMGIEPMDLEWDGDKICKFTLVANDGVEWDVDITVIDRQDDIKSIPHKMGGQLVVLRSLYSMLKSGDYSTAIELLIELRKAAGTSVAAYAPATPPAYIPLLYALGVDLFDTAAMALEHGGEEYVPVPVGYLSGHSNSSKVMDGARGIAMVLSHAVQTAESGELSHLIEGLASVSAGVNILLRRFYAHSNRVWCWYPVTRPIGTGVRCISPMALERPDIKRWRYRISQWYLPPHRQCLILLPCSARKPYSNSRTHRRIKEIYNDLMQNYGLSPADFHAIFHEVIVTSPLGSVPRELERTYPAAHYDTPVADIWDMNELYAVAQTLGAIIGRGKYKSIIVHPSVANVVESAMAMAKADMTLNQEIAYCSTMDEFKGKIGRAMDSFDIKYGKSNGHIGVDIARAIASYQFGPAIEGVIEQCEVKGHVFNLSIQSDGKRLMTYAPERGVFALTLHGGAIVHSTLGSDAPAIYIKDDFDIHGSILAPGITDANRDIAKGDEVIVIRNGEVVATGIALMSGFDMANSNYGISVKVREHVKKIGRQNHNYQ